jgi:hypothetical protein
METHKQDGASQAGPGHEGPEQAKSNCFVVMPISTPHDVRESYHGDAEHFRHVLEHLFIPAIEKASLAPLSPVAGGSEIIHAEIIRKLETSDLVLCDMSSLNANVFFELGIRTAIDKPVALVRDQHTAKVPFDATLINHHVYDGSLTPWSLQNEVYRLSEYLIKTINTSQQRSTLWRYFGLSRRAEIPAPASIEEKLNIILDAVAKRPQTEARGYFSNQHDFSNEEIVIARAQEIARELSAQFTVVKAESGNVVLDLGEYLMPGPDKAKIERLAKKKGVHLTIVGGAFDSGRHR